MLERMLQRGADFVAGAYWRRDHDRPEVAAAGPRLDEPTAGSVPVEAVGFGCVLLTRSCCERMTAAYRAGSYTEIYNCGGGPIAPLFTEIVSEQGAIVPEDYSFCSRWRALGGEIWALADVDVEHAVGLARQSLRVERAPAPAGCTPSPERCTEDARAPS